MSEEAGLTERNDPAGHKVANFACGEESLDRWLHRYAGQSEGRDATRTFVAANEHRVVRGYYTLVAGQLDHAEATERVRKNLSRHFPIPTAILARLAADERSQGQGLGASLLNDAFAGYAEPHGRSPFGQWWCMRSARGRRASTSVSVSAALAPRRGR